MKKEIDFERELAHLFNKYDFDVEYDIADYKLARMTIDAIKTKLSCFDFKDVLEYYDE